jgi:hypothetical protein
MLTNPIIRDLTQAAANASSCTEFSSILDSEVHDRIQKNWCSVSSLQP